MAIRVEITANLAEVRRDLGRVGTQQAPFALATAINSTLIDAQKEQREGMGRRFTLRRKTWAERSVKISEFAKKKTLEGEIRIQTPGDPSRSGILTQHEEGGTKRPKGTSLAIPVDARRTAGGIVQKSQRPKAFNFKGSGRVLSGDKRTLLIREPGGEGVILQRQGRGKRGKFRVLFNLEPHAHLDPRLGFVHTVRRVIGTRFEPNLRAAFSKAIRTAIRK